MSPETKEVLDYLLAFGGAGCFGSVALALFGWLKAKAEKPHIAAPTVSGAGLAQIGGMVMAQQTAQDIIDALRGIAASHDRCTLAREAEMQSRRKAWEERQAHERRIAEERHEDHRALLDEVKTLNDRLRHMRPA